MRAADKMPESKYSYREQYLVLCPRIDALAGPVYT
jgi:hypothetical protein